MVIAGEAGRDEVGRAVDRQPAGAGIAARAPVSTAIGGGHLLARPQPEHPLEMVAVVVGQHEVRVGGTERLHEHMGGRVRGAAQPAYLKA